MKTKNATCFFFYHVSHRTYMYFMGPARIIMKENGTDPNGEAKFAWKTN